jgi:hypothetical protein
MLKTDDLRDYSLKHSRSDELTDLLHRAADEVDYLRNLVDGLKQEAENHDERRHT